MYFAQILTVKTVTVMVEQVVAPTVMVRQVVVPTVMVEQMVVPTVMVRQVVVPTVMVRQVPAPIPILTPEAPTVMEWHQVCILLIPLDTVLLKTGHLADESQKICGESFGCNF